MLFDIIYNYLSLTTFTWDFKPIPIDLTPNWLGPFTWNMHIHNNIMLKSCFDILYFFSVFLSVCLSVCLYSQGSFAKWSSTNDFLPNEVRQMKFRPIKKSFGKKKKKKFCQKRKNKLNSWGIDLVKPNWSLVQPMSHVAKPHGRCWLRRSLAVLIS